MGATLPLSGCPTTEKKSSPIDNNLGRRSNPTFTTSAVDVSRESMDPGRKACHGLAVVGSQQPRQGSIDPGATRRRNSSIPGGRGPPRTTNLLHIGRDEPGAVRPPRALPLQRLPRRNHGAGLVLVLVHLGWTPKPRTASGGSRERRKSPQCEGQKRGGNDSGRSTHDDISGDLSGSTNGGTSA